MKANPILIAVAIAGILVAVSVLLEFMSPQRIIEQQMDIMVSAGKNIGFDVGTDAVHFGKLPPNNEATRKLIVSSGDSKIKVILKPTGDIGSWVTAYPNDFDMVPRETKEITLVAHVPPGTEQGKYYGTLQVIFKSLIL